MNPLLHDLIVYSLATYYLSITATKLAGPFGLAERARHLVYRRRGFTPAVMPGGAVEWFRSPPRLATDAAPPVERLGDDWVTEGVSCPLCGSVYASAVVLLLSRAGRVGPELVLLLALAGAASFVYTLGRTWD